MTVNSLVIMIMSGPDDGQCIFLSREHGDGQVDAHGCWLLTLGRLDECDVSIPFDIQVSRQHAQLRVDPQGVIWLIDTGSLNGTFLNGTRLVENTATVVKRGELFRLGRTWLRIQPETDGGKWKPSA